MNDKKEFILCAATWYKDDKILMDDSTLRIRGNSPYNVDRGIVLCGWRHNQPIYQKVALIGLSDGECGEHEQGFLTSKNRFVSREEGAKIHLESGGELKFSKRYLYSEDLY